MELANIFDNTPAQHFELREKRTGVYQVIAPLFHEDGDMMSIYLSEAEDGKIKISDAGMSLMRLSYTFDIDTDNKRKILEKTLSVRGAENDDGDIFITTTPDRIYPAIMEYSQLINNVCNLDILSRENISSLFYENLRKTINELSLPKNFRLQEDTYMPGYKDLKIDYIFQVANMPPLCLFGIKDTNKAQQVTICCLQMMNNGIRFKSSAVFENMDSSVTKFARNSLVNAVGKVFSDIDGFKENGERFIINELTA